MPDNITQFESVGGFSGANLFVSGGATFSGTLTATTAAVGTNTTQVATTAFVQNEIVADTVTAFNGLTGAVGGVTTSAANTFTALQTFNSGISASGGITFGATAAFRNSIVLQNAEFIRNTTDGRIDLMPAPSSTTAFGLSVDLTTWTYGPRFGTIKSSDGALNDAQILFDVPLTTGNDTNFSFGNNAAYWFRMNTTGNDTLFIATPCGVNGYSSAVALMDYAASYANGNRNPGTVHTHPNLYIYSAGAANANDFIRLEHNRTNANIVTGGTSGILIQPGSGWLGISGGISAAGGATFAQPISVNRARIGVTAATNLFFGNNTGLTITTGVNNVLIGSSAGDALTTGYRNIAIGDDALGGSTAGFSNIAIGRNAMASATTTDANIAIGDGALNSLTTGRVNFALGINTLGLCTTGEYNVGVGINCMTVVNTGVNNTAIGVSTLNAVTTGVDNVAVGTFAGNNIGSASNDNTAIGVQAMLGAGSNCNNNVAIGAFALRAVSTGSNNTTIGYDSLRFQTSTSNNVGIGFEAGKWRSGGVLGVSGTSNSVFIGAGTKSASDSTTNETVIGYNAVGLGSNTTVIGSTSQTSATIYGTLNAPNGISAAGGITFGATAAFQNSIVLQNSEFIRNTTNGQIDFMPAPSSATAFGLYVDTTSWGYGTVLGTVRSSDGVKNTGGDIRWDSALVIGNDTNFSLGSSQVYRMAYTSTGNDTLQITAPVSNSLYSGAIAIIDNTAVGNANRSPGTTHSNPNFYIYSNGASNANDFIRLEHDRTNANIVTGQTSGILMQPGSGFVGISGGISASGGVTFASKVNAIQGVVSGYPRLEWCGLCSGFDIIPTGWQNMSAPISTSPTANDAYFAPIFISSRIRVTGIGHQTGTASSGNTGSFILGLYDSDDYGYPRNRLYASASTTLSTSNFASQRITGVNTTVNPGQYWIAIAFSAAGITTTGLGRLGTRMKFMTPTSQSVIGQASVDGLRRAQGGFTLAATQGATFTNVEGPSNPCIFYNGEFI